MRHDAIRNLYPNVVTIDDGAGAFDAEGNSVAVDEQAVQAEITRLQADYAAKQYQRDRAAAYPRIPDQLDVIYHQAWTLGKNRLRRSRPPIRNQERDMSRIALEGNVSGTGVFTLASPNGNTNRTLTLPDEAGTVLTSVSSLPAANLTGSLPAGMGGNVLQVVEGSTDTQVA
jgi:hypothetical protein